MENLKPREKAQMYGFQSLSNQELLAILIRTGYKGSSALHVAQDILDRFLLIELPSLDLSQILQIKGIKEAKGLELLASFELSKRISYQQVLDKNVVDTPDVLLKWLKSEIGFCHQEHFLVTFLNTKNHIISYRTIFIGTLDTSIVHPREIFKAAIQLSASKIICVHNHPSSDSKPSNKDVELTKMLQEAGALVGIPLLDHIIIGQNSFFSFKANQLIE